MSILPSDSKFLQFLLSVSGLITDSIYLSCGFRRRRFRSRKRSKRFTESLSDIFPNRKDIATREQWRRLVTVDRYVSHPVNRSRPGFDRHSSSTHLCNCKSRVPSRTKREGRDTLDYEVSFSLM